MGKKIRYQSAVAAAIGVLASMLFSLIIDWEIVGGVALVVAPLLLVSVVLVFVLEAVSASYVVKLAAFVSPLVFVLANTVYAMWADSCDPIELIARFILEVYGVGLAVATVCLIALTQRAARRSKRSSKGR